MAEIPDASDDEILHHNYEKIDIFSELSFSNKPIQVRNFDAKNLPTGRNFLMMEITRENLPKVLEILQRESPQEPDDQILDRNYEKLDYMSEDRPEIFEIRRGPYRFTKPGKNQKPSGKKSLRNLTPDILSQNGIPKTSPIDLEMNELINSFQNKGEYS